MLYKIALTQIHPFTPETLRKFADDGIDARMLIEHPEEALGGMVESARVPLLKRSREQRGKALEKAQREIDFATAKGIRILAAGDDDYPLRLSACADAPSILYYRGNADLNAPCVIAIVGTRRATDYGHMAVQRIVAEMAESIPQLLVVSGLAYGIDIAAHRAALSHDLPTVGVVAHGMDTIYPAAHRNDAATMTRQGGVITEYVSGTRPFAMNFLRRNRIIAALADATLVVESAAHGGALATARLADSYGRTVMAIPGRLTDRMSEGCNRLIFRRLATSVSSADDIINLMEWQRFTANRKEAEPDLFAQTERREALPPEQRNIIAALENTDGLPLFELQKRTALEAKILTAALVTMEINGIIQKMPSGTYHFLGDF